jgi:hypothetical protein
MKSLITVLFFLACFTFQDTSEYLFGTWECYHKELEDGTTTNVDPFSGKEFEYSCEGITLKLNSDATGIDGTGIKFNYQKKDSILTLGTRKYIIEKLTNTRMVLREYDPRGMSFKNFRTKFKKQD